MRRIGVFALVLFGAELCSVARSGGPGCGTTRESGREAIFLHRQSARARRARTAALAGPVATAAGDRDIGNIAIIEDSGGVVEKLNQFNLDGASIAFSPTASNAATYRYAAGGPAWDAQAAAQGSPLIALGDDDAREVALPFSFPFFGAVYRKVWINSDGNLTFNVAESASTSRLTGRVTGGPPRIAGLFDDLDPSQAPGGVRFSSDTSHVVFSWVAVPEWQGSGTGAPQTFQIALYADGRIVLAYAGANPASAVVGIAPGGARGTTSLVSFKNDASGEYTAAVVERFGNSLEIDIVLTAQRFFQTHGDAYDYLVIYNNEGIAAMPGAVAYESTVRSSGSGWGAVEGDNGAQYGSGSRLKSVLNMGYLSQYPKDPAAVVPARAASQDTPVTVLGHEAGHLFLALASVPDPNDPAGRPMLGYGGVHWSFVFNSEASLDEGEQITDYGPPVSPRFTTTAVTQGYSPLDQYLMGWRAPGDVPPTFLVTGYPASISPLAHPAKGVAFDGKRMDVTIDDVIRAEGRRIPDDTVAQRRYRFGFILVTAAGQPVAAEDVQQVDAYRQQFEGFFAKASGGNAAAETTLNRSLKLSVFPAAGVIVGGSSSATLTVESAPKADLAVMLQTARGFAQTPSMVRIAAGSTTVSFPITGIASGVEELTATPADPSYETAFARVQVADAAMAKLSLVSDAGDEVTVRLSDANGLPYAGARLIVGSPQASVPAAVTDARGLATFAWATAPGAAAQLRITAEAAAGIALTVNRGGTGPVIAAVVNAASYAPGISPGSIETIFGVNLTGGARAQAGYPWPDELAGARVTMGGSALPLLYASDTQISFYVPEATPLGPAAVSVMVPWGVAASFAINATAAQPGIFGVVAREGYLEIYATGLGTTHTAGGFEVTAQAPAVYVGAARVVPVYSGLAPGFVGLYQVNVRIPDGISGTAPVVIASGNVVSNEAKVTVR